MKKENILVNFYPFLLWNTRVFGNIRNYVKSNLYERSAEIERLNDNEYKLKTDFVESVATRANSIEYLFIKYVPAFFVLWLLFNMNLYYVSQMGLFLASIAYIGFFLLKERNLAFFGWLYIVGLFGLYIFLFSIYPKSFVELKGNWVVNYALQYFALFYVLESVLEAIFTERLKDTYKIQKYYANYFVFNNEEIKTENYLIKKKVKKYFKFFLGLVASVGLLFGGIDVAYKIKAKEAAVKKILTETQNEAEIIKERNAEALIELLNQKSEEVGIRVHTKEDIEMIRDDFDKYKRVGIISYGTVAFSKDNKVVEIDSEKRVYFGFKKTNYIYKKAWVKRYKDGFYRWHFKNAGKIYVITDIKAR